jgi:membrane-associated protease RseP (regulator of RpoE activity)
MDHQPGTNPPVKTTQRKITSLHIFLFVATLVTTLIAGALQQGVNVLNDPLSIWQGIPFSFSLIIILGTHELGHYIMSRRHHVDVTLPYFIPAPSFIGTFGAVIKLKSPLYDRRTLLDIGVAGPFAGLIVAVPILAVGLSLSEIVPYSGEEGIRLGTCLLFSIMNWIINGPMPENASLMLHPVAFSGWIGLLVTALNLLPVGQLDGGHVAYAIFGRRQRVVARVFMAMLLFLGVLGWTGWFVWFALLLFIGIDHPPVTYGWIRLDGKRRLAGWIAIFVFAVTFMPAPF